MMADLTYREIARILDDGDVAGRLGRDDLPTPALLLDLDLFERNIRRMVDWCRTNKRQLRPHGKTHKCPEVARALIKAGAVGACVAKLAEAEVFAAHGVTGLLVTTPVVGRHKIERAIELSRKHPDTLWVVDDAGNAADLNATAGVQGVRLEILIDVRVGKRGGVQPGLPALKLAQTIVSLPNLHLCGMQAYAGNVSHVIGFSERKRASEAAMDEALATRRLWEEHGIACPLLTGGSTGTYNIDSGIAGISELQPGSFIFMDRDYEAVGGVGGATYDDFAPALSVLTTVVSRPSNELAVVDGGTKTFSTDRPLVPVATGGRGMTYDWAGDEHGRLRCPDGNAPAIGTHIEFNIPHCDPTVNLHDRMYCLRGDRVEAVWRIAARGMSQ